MVHQDVILLKGLLKKVSLSTLGVPLASAASLVQYAVFYDLDIRLLGVIPACIPSFGSLVGYEDP